MAVAQLTNGIYELSAPEQVGHTASLLARLQRRAQGMQFMVGFDFPIGVPLAYAQRAGITDFLAELPEFGQGRWSRFYDLAETKSDISPQRPFYPYRPGGTSQQHLVDGLGVGSVEDLYRACDVSKGRPAACSLFWTLGAAQVGRAAISGWREVVAPALSQSTIRVAVWPFHGDLQAVLQASECVLAETYPAEGGLHIGLDPPGAGWKKGSQVDRQRQGAQLLRWAKSRPEVRISPALESAIRDGFSSDATGEDRFDAVVGLMSMLEVVTGHRSDGAPQPSAALEVEGWIFGQQADATARDSVAEGARGVWRRGHGAAGHLGRLDEQDGPHVDSAAEPQPGGGDRANGGNMTPRRLLGTAGDAVPMIEALLALKGEDGIDLVWRKRCASMRVKVDGDDVPMLSIFATGVHFSPDCPCLYIDGKVLRERRSQESLDTVRARLARHSSWRRMSVDAQCSLDHAFSEDEIRAVVGFARWLRDQISKPVGAA